MKTTFKDPIAVKDGKRIKSPWNFNCPPYDERTSCYVDAGSHYGVGHRQPVGHKGDPKMRVATMPFNKREGMAVDEAPRTQLKIEIRE